MSKAPHFNLIVTDPDQTAPVELADAQPPVVLDYQDRDKAAIESAKNGNGQSLKQRAVRSSMWTLTAFAIGQVIRFVSNPILAYLLIPEDFGVVRLVSFFVTGLAALADVGIEQSIIQNKRGDDKVFLDTAWTLHIVRGACLWLGSCIIAYPVYWFFREQSGAHYLLWMIPISGLSPLIAGFNSTAMFTLHRHLQLGKLTVLNLIYACLNVAVTILIAWKWQTPWAFIIGGLAANVFFLIASHMLIPGYRNRFCWDKQTRGEIMTFGKWIMISTLITYTANQIDQPMVGRLLAMHWLGLYGIAMGLVMMPREVIGRLASVSLFPALSRAAENNPADLPRVLYRARSLILTVSLAGTLGVILGARVFIMIFYKDAYHPAGWLAQIACIGAWFMLLTCTADRALLTLGKTKPLAVSNAVNLIVTIGAGLIGRYIDLYLMGNEGGIVGFMLGMAAGKLAAHLMIQVELAKCGIWIFRQDTLYSGTLLALAVAGIVIPKLLPHYQHRQTLYEGIVAVVFCGITCGWAGLKVLRGIK